MKLPPPLRSASHPLLRQARNLDRGARQRRESGLFLVEGPRGVGEALDAGSPPVWVLAGARAAGQASLAPLLERLLAEGIPVQPVQDAVLARCAPSEHGPGLLAACRLPDNESSPESLIPDDGPALICCCLGIQNPGSVGALIRSAAAFGTTALAAFGGADPWNSKSVRASAGAIHRLPVARGADPAQARSLLERKRLQAIAAVPRGGRAPGAVDWSGRRALLLGSEVRGLPRELLEIAEPVTIPMRGEVESLSVAVAGSILLAGAGEQPCG